MKNRMLFIVTKSETIFNFRIDLISDIIKNGFDVYIAADDSVNQKRIEQIIGKKRFYNLEGNNRSINPFKIFSYRNKIAKIIELVKPDVVFTFQLKPNLFGPLCAKKAKTKYIFSMIEGVGDVFIKQEIKYKIIKQYVKFGYRKSLAAANKVFFLNDDDINDFRLMRLVKKDKIIKTNGIGVSLEKFEYTPLLNDDVFLMVARLLKSKGVLEFCQAANIVKKEYPSTTFNLVGEESEIKAKDLKEYIDNKSVSYLGKIDDVRNVLKNTTFFVLPSYREGLPMASMEAMATGRPIITTNVPGCRETIKEGYNGFFVKEKNVGDLAEKMIFALKMSKTEKIKMGLNSRELAKEKFDRNIINENIIKVILDEMSIDK